MEKVFCSDKHEEVLFSLVWVQTKSRILVWTKVNTKRLPEIGCKLILIRCGHFSENKRVLAHSVKIWWPLEFAGSQISLYNFWILEFWLASVQFLRGCQIQVFKYLHWTYDTFPIDLTYNTCKMCSVYFLYEHWFFYFGEMSTVFKVKCNLTQYPHPPNTHNST